jgi:hypothetical protein
MAADRGATRLWPFAVVLLLLLVSYMVARIQAQQEIARVKLEAEQLRAEKDSIEQVVARHTETQARLAEQRDEKEVQVALLRELVTHLERESRAGQLTVRRITKTSALQSRLEQTFPELAAAHWGVTNIPFDTSDTLGIEYFLIPAWFTETFIIDHQNALLYEQQKHKLFAVDSLQRQIASLGDSLLILEEGKTLALQAGYSNAFLGYQGLSERYIAELRKPRFSLGSTVGVCLGAAGLGAAVGVLVGR